MSRIEVISVPEFSIALLLVSLHYAMSRLLSPDHTLNSAINLETYFYEVKTPFLICLAAAPPVAMMMPTNTAGSGNPIIGAVFLASIALPLIGIFVANRRSHAVIVVLYAASYAVQETLQSAVGQS